MRKIKKITVRMNNGDVLEYEGADKGTKIEEGNIFKVVARTTETNYNLLMCRLAEFEDGEWVDGDDVIAWRHLPEPYHPERRAE